MGTHRDGDNLPPDGDRGPEEPVDLPDLPELPDGVAVPDDPADLAAEAELVRSELAEERRLPWSAPPGATREGEPSIGTPLLIMSVAVVITLVSLFAMFLSGATGPGTSSGDATPLPELVLTDGTGRATNLAAVTPVAVLLVEDCDCTNLIADTAVEAPPGVTVVAIADTPPERPAELPAGVDLRLLADPDRQLRAELALGPPPSGSATVVLADPDEITYRAPAVSTVGPYGDALARLGSG